MAPPFTKEIRFEDVTFSYTDKEVNLDKVSFVIPAGKSVAFVGRSGSGKSTVLNLLARFYQTAEGAITLDGRDLKQVSDDSFRSQIGTVFQDTFLFSTTIRENIRQGRLEAVDEEVESAAKAAEIHDFIVSLPESYDTQVGEMGGHLSGGQKQRLSLARAILRNPAILILDEATSALDPATEAAVNATLENLARDRTLISVTHRLTSAMNMDRVFVLEHGQLVEQGTHRELLNLKGVYYEMWQDFTLELTQDAIMGDVASKEEQEEIELSTEEDPAVLAQRIQRLETDLRNENQELERQRTINYRWAQLAGTDRLTGMPNKIAFLQALMPQEIQQAQRIDASIGFMLISGDNLGSINETYGRDAGDEVIRGLAKHLESILKGEEQLGHFDGTNFAVSLYPADLEETRQRAEEIRNQIRDHGFSCAGNEITLTISTGITAIHSADIDDSRAATEDIFQKLNGALYQAKRNGGDRVETV